MDWPVARRIGAADSTGSWTAGLTVFAVAVMLSVSAAGQDRSAVAVKHWRAVDGRPQATQRPLERSLPPSTPLRSAQVSYDELPYVDEFVAEHDPADYSGSQPCRPGCGCGQPSGCREQLSRQGTAGCGYWLSGEYLLWSISGYDLPPLVTTSLPGTLPENTGVLGRSGTGTIFGGDSDDLTHSGFRIAGGWWLDRAQGVAAELEYAGLPRQSERDSFDSLNFPLLARPVFDTLAGAESAMLVAHPDFLSGAVAISASSQFHLAGAIRRDRISQSRCRTVDSLIGFRFASLEENLLIEQSSRFTVGTGQVIAGTTLDLFDRFETQNRFYGVVLGLDGRQRMGPWVLNARGSLSMGNSRTEVMIDGATVTSVPAGGTSTAVGGLLAQQTNIGTATRNKFSLMPELSLGMSTHLNRCWQFNVGYRLLYWSEVARPGEQIDRQVSQFPPEPPSGTFNPSLVLDTRGVLIHGLQTGLAYHF